ncbi:MAG TPA: hypothetical protein ENJ00_03235 [Phycisphaerales bacterium]|nr:hypothetical protein [Phycisphaerales bacterium]
MKRCAMIGLALVAGAAFGQARERVSPYMQRTDPQDWVLRSSVGLYPITERRAYSCSNGSITLNPTTYDPGHAVRGVEQGSIFFPLAMHTGSSELDPRSISAKLLIAGEPVRLKQTIIDRDASDDPLHSGAAYGDWSFGDLETMPLALVFTVETRMRCWNTEFDEASAMRVPWPKGEWPKVAASTFEPMLFVDEGYDGPYDKKFVTRLADRLTNGQTKTQPPMVVAKWIAGELAKSFQPQGNGIVADAVPATGTQSGQSIGAISAIEVVGAAESAKRGKGSPFDLPLLLDAVYHEVGLPSRVVIGYVAGGAGGDQEAFRALDRPEVGLYAWVEVALYDESQPRPDQQLTWVPVNILRIRGEGAFRRPLDQPWPGFGSDDQLNEILPISFHLHPHRMGAIAYGMSSRRKPRPALWGWNLVPNTPDAVRQVLAFSATSPAIGPGDNQRNRRGQ